ncbi:uncharacterized protein N7529_010128 [Penicillium soppii]|uniref:uncharacterized protein n=1 Tax=Penicillium soppii TaxID=69789 RepID=UPI0025493679|nr:uncharacterized protein N7529_010128 [Penicillium soppii]KAJ5856184.1 hypothetical protein N7529_010128 [Penicillium soppii]
MEIDQILERFTNALNGSLHGAGFNVLDHSGKEIYSNSVGKANFDHDNINTVTPDSLCCIASVTKFVMAVAVMQLVERGIISMDDDVRAIIPELRDMTVFENTDLVLVDSTTYIALGASDLMITGGSVSSSPAYTKLLPILKFHEKGMDSTDDP